MSTISLGNGGTYCNGTTWYAFSPYGRNLPRLEGYKKISIGNLRNVWAKAEDRGSYDKTYCCDTCYGKFVGEDHEHADKFLYHVQPRYSINIPGWGSNTVGSHLYIFEDEINKAEFQRLYKFLTAE